MKIAVTDTMVSEDKYKFYSDWLTEGNPDVEIVKLSYLLGNISGLDKCGGIVLSGGNDVDPSLYHGPSGHPRIKDADPKRDDFERKLLDRALAGCMPLLAICRGIQLVNVHFGGTLIPDIEEAGYRSHRTEGKTENFHRVSLDRSSVLFEITGAAAGTVNSHHHQGIDVPGRGLKIIARADDGIIEAMEFDMEMPFGVLLQWHPERMRNSKNPLESRIKEKFISTIKHT